MKTTRKLLAFVMVIAMIMAMAVSASAETVNVTIENSLAGATYSFYKILDWDGTYYTAVSGWKTDADVYLDFGTNGYVTFVPTDSTALVAGLKSAAASHTADKTVTGTAGSTNVTLEGGPGYYLMISSVNGGTNASLARIATGEDLIIREKNTASGLPTINKTMEPVSGQFLIGQTRTFTITIKLDEGDTKYTITDTMTGLKLKEAITPPTVANAAVNVTAGGAVDDTGFTITIDFNDGFKSQANTEVIITYVAEITDINEIKNYVELEDHTSPTDDNPKSEVSDKQYNVSLKKTDATTGTQLDGAEFVLQNTANEYAKFAGGVFQGWSATETAETKITLGQITLKGLDTGTYNLTERQAPVGYQQLSAAVNIQIDVNGNITMAGATDDDHDNIFEIANTKVNPLPETGGMGTTLFYTLGGLMVMAAAVLLVTKKRVCV